MTTGAPTADGATTPANRVPVSLRRRAAAAPRPPTAGLYDPRFEHDACGVALVADLEGRPVPPAGAAGRQRPRAPGPPGRHRERGGFRRRGRHPDPGPRRLLPGGGRLRPARPGPLRHRHRLPVVRRVRGGQGPRRGRAHRRRGGARGGRLARAPRRSVHARLHRRVRPAVDAPALRGAGRRRRARSGGAGAGPRPAGLRGAQAGRARGRDVLLRVAVGPDGHLQGDAHVPPARRVLPRSPRRAAGQRAGPGALAVLDQHLPVVAAGPPLPVHGPQRRDQHPGRQPELDAGPRGPVRHRPDSGARAGLSRGDARRQRLGLVRRGAGAAPPRGPADPPRRADDDPRGVGEPPHDGRRPAGLLPLPRLAHGAVGRPGRRGLHRRHGHRRGPRPQRPATRPLLGDRRGPRGPGQRSRRPGRTARPGWSARDGCSRAGCSWSTPRPGGSWTTTRSRTRWPPSTPTPRGWSRGRSTSTTCRPGPCSPRSTPRWSVVSGCSGTPTRSSG